jgi:hypothetical protein
LQHNHPESIGEALLGLVTEDPEPPCDVTDWITSELAQMVERLDDQEKRIKKLEER